MLSKSVLLIGCVGLVACSYADLVPAQNLKIIVAVSTSMSENSIRGLVNDVTRVGGQVVVRGIPIDDDELQSRGHFALSKKEQMKNRELIRRGFLRLSRITTAQGGVLIDPLFFREKRIERVPYFFIEQDGYQCSMIGTVSLAWALSHCMHQLSLSSDTDSMKAEINRYLSLLPPI